MIYIDRERERWLQAAKNGIEKPVMRYALESDGWEFRKLLKENNTTVERVVELVQADRDGRCVVLPCDNETPSNGDRIRRMSDEELCGTIYAVQKALCIHFAKALGFPIEELKFEEDAPDILERLQQPAKEG